MQFNLDKEAVTELRKQYNRAIQIDFIVKSQTFACFTDLNPDGGFAPSSTFYKMSDGKADDFLFWTSRPVNDPNVASYVFKEFFAKDGLTSENAQALLPSATAPTRTRRRYTYQHVKKYDMTEQFMPDFEPDAYGILRLENEKECVDSYGVLKLNRNLGGNEIETIEDITDLQDDQAIGFQNFGISKLQWLDVEGQFVKNNTMHEYTTVDKGMYEVVAQGENFTDVMFDGTKLKGLFRMDTASGQIRRRVDGSEVSKSLSSRDIEDVYVQLGINTRSLGCVMLDVETIQVSDVIDKADLQQFEEDDADYLKGFVSESVAHVTLLYGLMSSAQVWKEYIEEVLSGWSVDNVKIASVDFFPGSQAEQSVIVAKVEPTEALLEGNARLRLFPHIDTFAEYNPHITLAYIQTDDAKRDEYIEKLNEKLAGKTIAVTGLNYGE